ncbi:MAG: hypothetical protein H6815_10755 [Phycisphaeraceae bacterium]|nr:hypothetical protein [Phycisphaerales bacterium]MCB9860915.1 hypothetical protein [Phycisphaeraceae bacterium]
MKIVRVITASTVPLVLFAGCTSTHSVDTLATGARVAGKPTPEAAAMFDQIKALEGDWYMTDDNGQEHLAMEFDVIAAGSAVREIMFRDSEAEMTNLYHLDGNKLVITHYCAAGNQPRMVATSTASDGSIPFKFESVSNLVSADGSYMGSLVLHMPDSNTLIEDWGTYMGEKLDSNRHRFDLKRR